MFAVLFEVHPKSDQWDTYLGYAKMLRPELEQVEGFVDNIRYRSLDRDGWILSLWNGQNEKALMQWRTTMRHHELQELGRGGGLEDYHLRVGQLTRNTKLPEGFELKKQRLDETEVGKGTAVVLIYAKRPAEWKETNNPADCAEWLGLEPYQGFEDWDLCEAVLTAEDIILMEIFKDEAAAKEFEDSVALPDEARLRRVRGIRDYTMYDRREAPQYYPEPKKP